MKSNIDTAINHDKIANPIAIATSDDTVPSPPTLQTPIRLVCHKFHENLDLFSELTYRLVILSHIPTIYQQPHPNQIIDKIIKHGSKPFFNGYDKLCISRNV